MTATTRPTTAPSDGAVDAPPTRRLLIAATATAVAADLGWMAFLGDVIPPPLGIGTLAGVSYLAFRGNTKRLAIAFGALAALFLVMGSRFVLAELGHPEDAAGFIWAGLSGGGRIVTVLAAAMLLRGRHHAPRQLAWAAVAAALAIVAIGGIGQASVASDERQPGDVDVVAERSTFPDQITVAPGGSVFVDNVDRFRHTFTVEGSDIDVDLPPTTALRVPIDLTPGTYHVQCTVHGHETMTSTLTVS